MPLVKGKNIYCEGGRAFRLQAGTLYYGFFRGYGTRMTKAGAELDTAVVDLSLTGGEVTEVEFAIFGGSVTDQSFDHHRPNDGDQIALAAVAREGSGYPDPVLIDCRPPGEAHQS